MTRPVFTHMKRHRLGVFLRLAIAPVLFIPTFATAQGSDFERDQLAKVESANSQYEMKRYADAAELYGQSMYTRKTRGLMFRYGISLVRSGQPDAAIDILEKVTRDNSLESLWDKGRDYKETSYMIAEAHFQLGLIYQDRGWWDLALGSFQDASSTGGSDWRAPYSVGYLLLSHWNDPAQALDYLNSAVNRHPDSVEIKKLIADCHNTIGVQRDQAGDEAGALAAFKEALQWRPGWDLAQKNIDAIANRHVIARMNEEIAKARGRQAARADWETEQAAKAAARPPKPDLPQELVDKFLETLSSAFVTDDVAVMLKEEPRLAHIRDYMERTPLHVARTREVAQLLLDAGTDPSVKDNRGGSAIFGAVTQETPGVAELLLEKGASIDERDDHNRTTLHEAIAMFTGPTETIEWIIEKTYGNILDKVDDNGVTPLMLATSAWDQRVVDLLLAHGADLTPKDEAGKTAADHAAANEKPELAAALQKLAGFSPQPGRYVVEATMRGDIEAVKNVLALAPGLVDASSDDGMPLLAIAAADGADELLDFLIKAGARLDKGGPTALARAAITGKLGAVRALLAAGVDARALNRYGTPAFQQALEEGADFECVKAMIDAGADIHRSAGQPLLSAASAGSAETVRLLLSLGANPKPENPDDSPLLYANAECTRILIEAGADVNARGTYGSPLDDAASKGELDRLKLLVEHGADFKFVDEAGGSVLHYAKAECAAFLIDRGADVNLRDNEGRTPLHAAVGYETIDTMKLLVERGADVNAIDSSGRSPLFGLDAERTRFLVEHGANPNIRDADGKTPLDLALESVRLNEEKFPQFPDWAAKPREVASILTQAGAKSGADLQPVVAATP